MLRALTLRQMRGSVTADGVLDNIERALDLGERPGFVMLFLEEGPPLVPLLNAVFAGDAPARTKGYARKLLLAFAAAGTADAETCLRSGEGLVEPLTAREAEVLALIASGDNNQTIADKLFISVRTVKKHVSNIFGKLNVSSRTQAVAQSRGLGLLPPD